MWTLCVTYSCNLCRFFRKHYPDLLDLFQCDPVLLQAFIILCPIDELSVLIITIPPYYSLSWLTYLASEIEKMSSKDVRNQFSTWTWLCSSIYLHIFYVPPNRVKDGVSGWMTCMIRSPDAIMTRSKCTFFFQSVRITPLNCMLSWNLSEICTLYPLPYFITFLLLYTSLFFLYICAYTCT